MAIIQPTKSESITPNAVFAPSIQFTTKVINGKLVTSALISMCQAQVTDYDKETESWKQGTISNWVQVADISKLPADLAALQESVNTAYESLKTMLGVINGIRQIV